MCCFVDSIIIIGGYCGFYNGDNDVQRSCVVFDSISENRTKLLK